MRTLIKKLAGLVIGVGYTVLLLAGVFACMYISMLFIGLIIMMGGKFPPL